MNTNVSLITARLDVDRSEFVKGLLLLARHAKLPRHEKPPRRRRPEKDWEVELRFEEGRLVVEIENMEMSAAARGRWRGIARTPRSFVHTFAKHAPDVNPLPIWIEGNRLQTLDLSIPCYWQMSPTVPATIREGATLAEILRIGMEHTDETLKLADILKSVQAARVRRRALVKKAVTLLEPLAVSAADVERMIDSVLRDLPDHSRDT